MAENKAYLTTSIATLTEEAYDYCSNEINKACEKYQEYKGEKAEKQQVQIAQFLCHLIHCSNVTNSFSHKYLEYVPIPISNSTLKKKYRSLFTPSSILGYRRGIDILCLARIINKKQHNYKENKSTEFTLSNWFIRGFLLTIPSNIESHEGYLNLKRGFNLSKKKNGQASRSIIEQYHWGTRNKLKHPRHNFSQLGEGSKQPNQKISVKEKYKNALDKLQPIEINVTEAVKILLDLESKLKELLLKKELDSNSRRIWSNCYRIITFLSNAAKNCEIISDDPNNFRIKTNLRYKITPVGGRMFEVQGGFQGLPGYIKKAIAPRVQNWDVSACQVNILKNELSKAGINIDCINKITNLDKIQTLLSITRKEAKTIIYSTIFNAGTVQTTSFSSAYKEFKAIYGKEKTSEIFNKWKKHIAPLKAAIAQLAIVYIAGGNKNQHGTSFVNQAGLRINLKLYSKSKVKDIRQLLAHMIQGVEVHYILSLFKANSNICSIEHDGVRTNGGIVKIEHYLELELKNG